MVKSFPFPMCGVYRDPCMDLPSHCSLVLGCNNWLTMCKCPPRPYSNGTPHVDSFYCHFTLLSSAVGLGLHWMTKPRYLLRCPLGPREQAPPTKVLFSHWAMRGSPFHLSLWTFPRKVRHQLLYPLKLQGHSPSSSMNNQLESGQVSL